MNKKLIVLNVLLIVSLFLTACGPASLSVQFPGSGGSNGGGAVATDNTLIYVLLGALILVVLIAVLGKRGSQ